MFQVARRTDSSPEAALTSTEAVDVDLAELRRREEDENIRY
jgi:hypothetical protein